MDTKSILIVDDNSDLRKTLSDILKAKGYRAIDAATGKAALGKAREEMPAVALIDLKLEDMSGIEVLRMLKERSPGTECIVLTGYASQESAIEAVNLGAYSYVEKPYNAGILLEIIRMAIEKRKANEQLRLEIIERKKVENELQDTLKELRQALRGATQAMALTVETRDPYTAGHQRRVADLARATAKEMGFPRDKITGIRMAGALHDIGKIAIPSEILSKPGRLNGTEFELIKNHPKVGYDILKSIKFPWPVAQIVLQHHERMDGSGYPQALSGEDILSEARILGVADVVEAMASHRPYRAALGIDKALEEISINRGKLYDVEVVNGCLKVFKDKGFKFK